MRQVDSHCGTVSNQDIGLLRLWNPFQTECRRHPEMPNSKAIRLKKQKGKCNWCGLHFREGDVLEEDHIIATALGGKNEYENLQLLHAHCHDEKTALDMREIINKRLSNFHRGICGDISQ